MPNRAEIEAKEEFMFWKSIEWKYDAVGFDEEWSELLAEIINGQLTDRIARSAETKYDRRYVISSEHPWHVERLLEHLRSKFPKYEFAAHTDYLNRKWWRIVARTTSCRAIPVGQMKKIRSAARAILRNIEAKYSGGSAKSKTGFWRGIADLFS